jgi:hypothetical protein
MMQSPPVLLRLYVRGNPAHSAPLRGLNRLIGVAESRYEMPSKFKVGVIHEAAVLFGGSPRIKNRQDITPTLNFRACLKSKSYLNSATPINR